MLFMNEYEIDDAVRRFSRADDTPNLLAGAKTLARLRDWTNRNSDGWPYWSKPCRSAERLQTLLQAADRFDPTDCTEAELKRAYVPIKTMLTRTGIVGAHAEVFPTEPEQTFRLEVRWDFTGTLTDARIDAQRIAGACGGEVTDIMDENWETAK